MKSERNTSANSTYKKLAVLWVNEALCFEIANFLQLPNVS